MRDKYPWHWTSKRIGEMIELTNEERERGKLWRIRPCDIPWPSVQAHQAERKRRKDRERISNKRKRRAKMLETGIDLDVREESLLSVLDTDEWVSVTRLANKLAGGRAWRRPDGRPILGASLQRIVRRNLDKLAAQRLIDDQRTVGRNGLEERRVRGRYNALGNADTRTRTVATRSEQRNARQMGTSEPSKNVASRSKKESRAILNGPATLLTTLFATTPRRYPPAQPTQEYFGSIKLPIRLRMRCHQYRNGPWSCVGIEHGVHG
jgi:hypothetical protein